MLHVPFDAFIVVPSLLKVRLVYIPYIDPFNGPINESQFTTAHATYDKPGYPEVTVSSIVAKIGASL